MATCLSETPSETLVAFRSPAKRYWPVNVRATRTLPLMRLFALKTLSIIPWRGPFPCNGVNLSFEFVRYGPREKPLTFLAESRAGPSVHKRPGFFQPLVG